MSESLEEVVIYTDGGCEPNPGAGGWAAVLLHPKKRMEISGGFRQTTNNRMEIMAAIRGLELLKRPCKVRLYSDSQYLVQAIMDGWAANWKRKKWWRTRTERAVNSDLWEKLLPLCETHQVEFVWVRGHAGVKENERCDELSCAELRKPNLPADEGYENRAARENGAREDFQEGEPCPKCETPLLKVLRNPDKKIKEHHEFYYEFHLACSQCKATYTVQAARREVPRSPTLFE